MISLQGIDGPMAEGPFDANMQREFELMKEVGNGRPPGKPQYRKDFLVGGHWDNGMPDWDPTMFDQA